ncbi:unnamed protein product [Microthlaspi erraticum]|uniref:Uncharacterized protein n=1 Tax=Microthlaspi erraticum TaxID=1685480 RepID=A0A6D2LB17_9BRAS|nr:unnamed protein product [Microthlaspi erraticum]
MSSKMFDIKSTHHPGNLLPNSLTEVLAHWGYQHNPFPGEDAVLLQRLAALALQKQGLMDEQLVYLREMADTINTA